MEETLPVEEGHLLPRVSDIQPDEPWDEIPHTDVDETEPD